MRMAIRFITNGLKKGTGVTIASSGAFAYHPLLTFFIIENPLRNSEIQLVVTLRDELADG
jgi:hypothetical protein